MEPIKRPDLKKVDPEVFAYIQWLEKIIEGYGDNGAVYLVSALNNQLRALADQVQVIDIDFSKTDDKTFDRFVQLVKLAREVTGDFKSLLQEYGDVIKTDDSQVIPLIERLARKLK